MTSQYGQQLKLLALVHYV